MSTPLNSLVRVISSTLPSSIGSTLWDPLSAVSNGVNFGTHLSRQIRVHNLSIVGNLVLGAANLATDDARNVVRIVVFLGDANFQSNISTSTFVHPNTIQGLYAIYHDKLYLVNTTARDSTGYIQTQIPVKINCRINHLIKYNSDTGSLVGQRIYVWFCSDSAIVPHPGFTSGFMAVGFKDVL